MLKLKSAITQDHGFTLVETLVASAILAVGLMGVATVISQSTTQDSRAYYTTRASLMVEEFLENATRMQYNGQNFRDMTGLSASTTIDGIAYTLNCSLVDNTPIDKCKEMTCILSWNNKGLQASTQYVYVYSPKY
ncbi:MAG: prepilin-type N-terminal cleavage/methylation domain-containing protein [Desulfovibrionales bacterium]|nr:prepilin-type N-terminal cleavage/methylation domain-containing protein [Desulfovibrionales bacterium]